MVILLVPDSVNRSILGTRFWTLVVFVWMVMCRCCAARDLIALPVWPKAATTESHTFRNLSNKSAAGNHCQPIGNHEATGTCRRDHGRGTIQIKLYHLLYACCFFWGGEFSCPPHLAHPPPNFFPHSEMWVSVKSYTETWWVTRWCWGLRCVMKTDWFHTRCHQWSAVLRGDANRVPYRFAERFGERNVWDTYNNVTVRTEGGGWELRASMT